ncbi:MAG: adenylosuccinate lyase [Coxiellaceae bacterium]|nr:adenylosuccinate lyase [Coxiellaceae bacterium]
MQHTPLTNLSPIDGRYCSKSDDLRPIMSEYGLIYYRTLVEIHWVIHLSEAANIPDVPSLTAEGEKALEKMITGFSSADAEAIKDIEKTTNHDVKAVEYFLQQKFSTNGELEPLIPFIHFGCTSEDINNLAYTLMVHEARIQVLSPTLLVLRETLAQLAKQTRDMPMLSRTHGQTASPTTMGKEIANVLHRFKRDYKNFKETPLLAKFNGAVGNFNAHHVAYPDCDWLSISKQFVEKFKVDWNSHTTQIEPHDALAELMHSLVRINNILMDLSRDIWGYISLGYFSQKQIKGEVGSSTMPHKVNPIDFENAEGNLGLANALANHMANKLPISRWQRDLTDSTVLRNLGVIFGYCMISYQSLLKGLKKLQPQAKVMSADLNQSWEVLGEAIQTVMRRYGVADAYEQLKALTRGQAIQQKDLWQLIKQLDIPTDAKKRLSELTPENYIGLASKLTDIALE